MPRKHKRVPAQQVSRHKAKRAYTWQVNTRTKRRTEAGKL